MKAICITGLLDGVEEEVLKALQSTGLPLSDKQDDPQVNMQRWHQMFMQDQDLQEKGQIIPGKFWEKFAADIFMRHLGKEIWGWVDQRSLSLLEYWRDFDANVQFLFLACTPKTYLRHRLVQQSGKINVDACLRTWLQAHEKMLRFHLRHRQRSWMIDIDQLFANPAFFLPFLTNEAHLPKPTIQTLKNRSDLLVDYIARQLIKHFPNPDVDRLYQEMQAAGVFEEDESSKNQVQEELEKLFLQHKGAQEELAKTDQEREKLQQTLVAVRGELEQAKQQHAQALKEQQEENELLLTQLHQVQEELERYFLAYREEQQRVAQYETRWQKLLQRHPEFFDYEHSTIVEDKKGVPVLHCQYEALVIAGREIPQLHFDVVLEGQVAGFRFASSTKDFFARWPNGFETLEILPAPHLDAHRAQARLQSLLDLATSDWHLIRRLIPMVQNTLEKESLPEIDTAPYRQGLAVLERILDKLPQILRFDRVRLERQQVNPDYEHLWLILENLEYRGERYPTFAFRLACANIGKDRFGTHPKLEFPRAEGATPLQHWYCESHDEFGDKLELRFALPDAMDLHVWQKMADDQPFILALLQALPAILRILEHEQTLTNPQRRWQDWQKLVQSMQQIIHIRTAGASQ